MFKTLYRCARTAARHENGPAARSRLAYLEHLAAGGATLHSLRANAGVLYRAAVCRVPYSCSFFEHEWAARRCQKNNHPTTINSWQAARFELEQKWVASI